MKEEVNSNEEDAHKVEDKTKAEDEAVELKYKYSQRYITIV